MPIPPRWCGAPTDPATEWLSVLFGVLVSVAHGCSPTPGRAIADALLLVASVASVLAVALAITAGRAGGPGERDLRAGLAVASVALSWTVVQTVFTFHYSRLYNSHPAGGIDFNQEAPPRYADFAYLAFTVGLIEEAVKLAALWLVARRLPRYTMRDGIVLGAAVGFGFARPVSGTPMVVAPGRHHAERTVIHRLDHRTGPPRPFR